MLISFIESLYNCVKTLLEWLGLLPSHSTPVRPVTRVIVKAGDLTLGLELESHMSIGDVKQELATRLNITQPDNLRIIFAGQELSDELSVDTCDLGNQSILHVVTAVVSSHQTRRHAGDQVRQEEKLSMFYTWCSNSDSLCPAKLRVRCSDCDESAVLVSRGPRYAVDDHTVL